MLKALLLAIMKLFAYLLVLHLGIDNLLLPPRREYSVSRLEGTRECNLCDSSVRILSNSLLSRFSTSEYFRAKRLFPFVPELSAETKWN